MQLSQSTMQPCGEFGGETSLNAAAATLALPGFSPEQVDSLTKLVLNILSDPEPPIQMPIFIAVPGTHLKHKRNVKTREQYKKKKAQAQHVTVQVQEVERMGIKAYVAEKASKHVTTSLHAVIPWFGMALFDGAFMVQNGAIGMRRMGVG